MTKFSIIAAARVIGRVSEQALAFAQCEPDDMERFWAATGMRELGQNPVFWGYAHLGVAYPGGPKQWTIRTARRYDLTRTLEEVSCRFTQHPNAVSEGLRGFPDSSIVVEETCLRHFLGACERSGVETAIYHYDGELNITPKLKRNIAA